MMTIASENTNYSVGPQIPAAIEALFAAEWTRHAAAVWGTKGAGEDEQLPDGITLRPPGEAKLRWLIPPGTRPN